MKLVLIALGMLAVAAGIAPQTASADEYPGHRYGTKRYYAPMPHHGPRGYAYRPARYAAPAYAAPAYAPPAAPIMVDRPPIMAPQQVVVQPLPVIVRQPVVVPPPVVVQQPVVVGTSYVIMQQPYPYYQATYTGYAAGGCGRCNAGWNGFWGSSWGW